MLKILHVSRQTLVQYVKKKEIRVVSSSNGTYDYNDDDVYRKAGLAADRMNVVYSVPRPGRWLMLTKTEL